MSTDNLSSATRLSDPSGEEKAPVMNADATPEAQEQPRKRRRSIRNLISNVLLALVVVGLIVLTVITVTNFRQKTIIDYDGNPQSITFHAHYNETREITEWVLIDGVPVTLQATYGKGLSNGTPVDITCPLKNGSNVIALITTAFNPPINECDFRVIK